MVLVEELSDDEVEINHVTKENIRNSENNENCDSSEKKEPALKRGFFDKAEPLYPPEGSPEGQVAPETHKAHTEHKLNQEIGDQLNRGAKENNGYERPHWYTKDYPKDCQYNSPGCDIQEMPTSVHANELMKDYLRGERWQEATKKGLSCMRLTFMSICDEDIPEIVERLRGDEDVKELDLSNNKIKDKGVQVLVGALANGVAPNLRELHLYSNEFGELGQTMLTKGLAVFRKKLEVHWKEAKWARLASPLESSSANAAPH
jgi:hypothetical protein